jgi:ABC-type dipeptide/oligopeptide/nickel transport system ATPase subunit
MTLLLEILNWTEEKLPLWQRDAARRLFQKEEGLSDDDYADLYELLKSANGLPSSSGLSPEPLSKSHIPASIRVGNTLVLKAMRDLKNVNRIAPNQELKFALCGMTVIYGGNGSGKSGYVRVMKRAFRARDQIESVHPDATDPAAQKTVPEAVFDLELNGVPMSVHWSLGSGSSDELATIAVFDSHCARAYLTAEHDVAYLPYGLDVVENLANKVIPELARRLTEEIATINIDCQPFQHLLGPTKVGQMISIISDKTDTSKVTALGTLSDLEVRRIFDLEKALVEADPKVKAIDLRLSASRVKNLAVKVESSLAWVTDAAISDLIKLDNATVSASKAETQAAEALRAGEQLLPGTGELVWKALFDAARKFSTEIAYPEHTFPHTFDGAVCPLCQQPLNESVERLKRFEKYIQDDVAKTSAEYRKRVHDIKKEIEKADFSFGLNESLAGELASLNDGVVTTVTNFQTSIETRRNWMLDSLNSHIWGAFPGLNENPRQVLRSIVAQQLRSSRTFARAVDDNKKKTLADELLELRARQNLSACLEALLALIERMKRRVVIKACEKGLKTKPISDKSKEFASSAVTDELKMALDEEFKILGIGHIKTRLKERNDKGKIKHQLVLDLPTINKLEQILSEGEQRAIALGSFLAELRLANHSGGIVFDDPVSSLDHKRRGKVAKRLAAESHHRQVVVFTHDVVFLDQLRDACEKLNLTPFLSFLEANRGYYGNVCEGLPWDHKSYKDRIDSLEKAQKRFEKLPWPADPSDDLSREMIRQYSFLRATIERVTQDFVLNGTVQRFKDYIDVKKLEKVVGLLETDVNELSRINKRCHDLVEAHDSSSPKDDPAPTPDELKQDIDDLKTLIQQITDRRKGVTV